MKRHEFEHTVRAAGAILGVTDVLVIGSQAIHASVRVSIPEVSRSIEADISALEDEDESKADLIDGSIGGLSIFQETFGYYAQGVTPRTAILPAGWRKRLVPFKTRGTQGVTAHCLELHDLWLSKAAAARPKDVEFCTALIRRGLVDGTTLRFRLKMFRKLDPKIRTFILKMIPE
ncbi:MAG TPA: DUF6036 family nucleotidyltransferase [Xanthomonadales bacterium]|nr:DUF6036 family nucleotidyltransferase [Xanthomonadales bacterium]